MDRQDGWARERMAAAVAVAVVVVVVVEGTVDILLRRCRR